MYKITEAINFKWLVFFIHQYWLERILSQCPRAEMRAESSSNRDSVAAAKHGMTVNTPRLYLITNE